MRNNSNFDADIAQKMVFPRLCISRHIPKEIKLLLYGSTSLWKDSLSP